MTAGKGRRVCEGFVLEMVAARVLKDDVSKVIPVTGVVGELSPAKLLRIDLEARSPSSKVQVGRVEKRAQRGRRIRGSSCSKSDGERG